MGAYSFLDMKGKDVKGFYVMICLCLLAANACQPSTARQQATSTFFQNFALGDVLNRMNTPELKCSKSLSTEVSGGQGDISSYRKASSLNCEILSQADMEFDELAFTNKLETEIEREITNSGARLRGGGTAGANFNCEYEVGGIYGTLEVVSMRVADGKYKLTYVIHELGLK